MSANAERVEPVYLKTGDLKFLKPFGVTSNIFETTFAIRRIFESIGGLATSVLHVARHETDNVEPSFGVLDQHFKVMTEGGSTEAVDTREIRVAPMGAGSDLMLGCFALSQLRGDNSIDGGTDLFDIHVPGEFHDFGYVTLSSSTASAGGYGYLSMLGHVTAFAERPSDDQLHELVEVDYSYPVAVVRQPLSRIDTSSSQAWMDARQADSKMRQ